MKDKIKIFITALLSIICAVYIWSTLLEDYTWPEPKVTEDTQYPTSQYTTVCLDGVEYWKTRGGGSYSALSPRLKPTGEVMQCTPADGQAINGEGDEIQ